MSFLKKHAADAADLTNYSSDHAAEAVDAVMKKYDQGIECPGMGGNTKASDPFPDGSIFFDTAST